MLQLLIKTNLPQIRACCGHFYNPFGSYEIDEVHFLACRLPERAWSIIYCNCKQSRSGLYLVLFIYLFYIIRTALYFYFILNLIK